MPSEGFCESDEEAQASDPLHWLNDTEVHFNFTSNLEKYETGVLFKKDPFQDPEFPFPIIGKFDLADYYCWAAHSTPNVLYYIYSKNAFRKLCQEMFPGDSFNGTLKSK